MIRLSLLLILLSASVIHSKSFTYKQIDLMPKSIEKDYYIWRLLKQKSISKSEAKKIIKQAKRISPKLKKAYKKKVGTKLPIKKKHPKPLSDAAKKKLKSRQVNAKKIIKSKTPFKKWLKQSKKEKIFIFNNVGKSGRKKLNTKIPKKVWRQLCKSSQFNKSIKLINKEKLNKLRQSFLYVPTDKNALSYSTLSMLGFYNLKKRQTVTAAKYFQMASLKPRDREEKDRALFWAYMSSKKRSYLELIVKSYDVNLYTLLARDILKIKYPNYPSPKFKKYNSINKSKISDPIYWVNLKKQIYLKSSNLHKLAEQYKSSETIGIYTFIKAKESRHTKHYFPMPYRDMLSKLPASRQAIMYAIARQESRFIPVSISSSYALGMMQIMPFLIDHLAKKLHRKVDYDDMFNPRTSLLYANEHMNYLTKWLQHPLYIAYAYNAGIGFTRRMLRSKLFASNKGLEPYLSIEMLPNAQARRYGKHVLVNYVIYMNKMGIKLRMIDLLSTLHIPAKTDKFRKK